MREECFCKVLKVAYQVVLGIAPVACKLKRVALCLRFLTLLFCRFFFACVSGGVAVIFCIRTVAYDEQLNIVEHSFSCPKTFTSVAINLIESFLNAYTTPFQFYVNQRKTIYKDCYIITIAVGASLRHILVDNL